MTYAFARALVALVLAATEAGAQSLGQTVPNGYFEYLVLLRTPAGALPPISTSTILGVAHPALQFVGRYGYVSDITNPLAKGTAGHDEHSLNSFGLTGIIPAGLAGTVSLTAGISNERCDGCSAQFMAALGGDYRFFASSMSDPQNLGFTVSVQAEAGLGKMEKGTAWSAKLGVPLAASIGAWQGTRVIPFLTPALALVRTSGTGFLPTSFVPGDIAPPSGALFSAGGGVALYNPKSRVGANIGFQYISISAADLQVGVAVSIAWR